MTSTVKTRSVNTHAYVEMTEHVDDVPSTWLDQEEARTRLTREALADVDAGRVTDHQAVEAWVLQRTQENQ